MADKPKLAVYWGSSCGGCEIAILAIHEKILDVAAAFDIVFWPCVMDFKESDVEAMQDGEIDVCLFNGAVRNDHNEHMAKLLRRKSKVMVAYGSCAMEGCMPGLANFNDRQQMFSFIYHDSPSTDNPSGVEPQLESQVPEGILELPAYWNTVRTLDQVVPVDYYLPGCPPEAIWTEAAVNAILSGELPPDGEMTPDLVRAALGLPAREGLVVEGLALPNRPPQLCSGCPHGDTFDALRLALEGLGRGVVTSDIGCYTLGALPPFGIIESCVCMGASVSMAKGASDAGVRPAVGVIGDSTFLHSGVTPLMDAVASNADMTLVIVDNGTTAMTGGQPTVLPSSRLVEVVKGVGVDPAHLHVVEASRKQTRQNAEILARELAYPGLSVVIAVRECIETVKERARDRKAAGDASRTKESDR